MMKKSKCELLLNLKTEDWRRRRRRS